MRACMACGASAPWLLPPGCGRCVDCLDEEQLLSVDLDRLAREVERELLIVQAEASRVFDGSGEGAPVVEAGA